MVFVGEEHGCDSEVALKRASALIFDSRFVGFPSIFAQLAFAFTGAFYPIGSTGNSVAVRVAGVGASENDFVRDCIE